MAKEFLGYPVPVEYSAGLEVDSTWFSVIYEGAMYAANADAVPFTTASDFDANQWQAFEGVTVDDLASSSGDKMIGVGLTTLYQRMSDSVSVRDFGAIGNGALTLLSSRYSTLAEAQEVFSSATSLDDSIDWAAIQTCIDNNYRKTIFFPQGNYCVNRPIVVPQNKGLFFLGVGFKASSVIKSYIDNSEYSNYGVIHVAGDSVVGYAGFHLANMHLVGNDTICHGVYLQYQYGCFFSNVLIEGFYGSGLCIDKCQDSTFWKVDVQNCGRSTGDYTSYVDMANNSLTTFAPVYLYTTVDNDECNFLRFYACQWEANRCSPTVNFAGEGIENYFSDIHIEHRNNVMAGKSVGTAFLFNGGDAHITRCGISEVQYGLQKTGYGVTFISDCGRFQALYNSGSGNTASFFIHNCVFSSMQLGSSSGAKHISNSKLGDVTSSYGCGPYVIAGCTMSSLTVEKVGAPNYGISVDNCTITGDVNWENVSAYGRFTNNYVVGACSFLSSQGVYSGNQVGGIETLSGGPYKYAMPSARKISYGSAAPKSGTYTIGDIRYNTAPAASGYIGWVCTASGSPGTWKGFGSIES